MTQGKLITYLTAQQCRAAYNKLPDPTLPKHKDPLVIPAIDAESFPVALRWERVKQGRKTLSMVAVYHWDDVPESLRELVHDAILFERGILPEGLD